MSELKLHILGCGSATPSLRHLPSSQLLSYRNRLMMIDCGEGAQLQMRRMGLPFNRLGQIFISHLHGDHCFGLPPLLSTLSLQEKATPLTVYTPYVGMEVLRSFTNYFCRESTFKTDYQAVPDQGGLVYEDNALTVGAFPLYHRVPCYGYIVREKPKERHILGEMVEFFNVPIRDIPAIKQGADWQHPDGRIIANGQLTKAPTPSVSYAYASDTMYDPAVAEAVRGVDVLYHEATYTAESADKARQRGHSTAAEAAQIAADAGVGMLILGHFSKRYRDEEAHLAEARAIFPNTIIADEGMTIDIEPKQC